MSGVIPSDDAFRRIQRTVRHFEKTYINTPRQGEKVVRAGRSGCANRNEVWKLKLTGTPTGGDFSLDVTVNSVTETITLNYDDTATEAETAFEGHSEIGSGQVNCTGGPFPGSEIAVEFIGGLAKTRMFDSAANIPVIDDSTLTGGTSPAAWIEFPQPGYPGNANS
jgi:hypothetical protein